MDFKILITGSALRDLEEIVAYIAHADPRAAQRVAGALLSRAESLSGMPRRGKALRGRAGVRRLVHHPYLIVYRVDDAASAVHVLRFWHGARNPKSLRLE